ncbi:MAG: hypothetical protein OXI59_04005, partial [Gemmatimonadota bacterium]|nr:hypothetical protein [Gemmatimonadota bacterium]
MGNFHGTDADSTAYGGTLIPSGRQPLVFDRHIQTGQSVGGQNSLDTILDSQGARVTAVEGRVTA